MRYYLRLFFITLFSLLFNSTNTLLIINAEQIPDPIIISTLEDDLTGDRQNETIELKGNLLLQTSNYYQDIWVEITSKHSKRWKIPLKGGYDPVVQLIDLNRDHLNVLFYQSVASENNQLYSHHLYSFKNGSFEEIPLPKRSYMEGHFSNNFQIEIQSSIKTSKPITINVEKRANEYIELGLYNTQGTLLRSSAVMIAPITYYEPALISKSKGYGLKSYQKVSGAYEEDRLGTIETLWYYENGNWIILYTKWI